MIEQLPKHEDEWAYYEGEPLFDYVCQVSDMMGETITEKYSDGSIESDPHLRPYYFASAFHEGSIDTIDIKKDLYESQDIQDTLRAFGLDSSKFWYLCLFIKWGVDVENTSARTFPNKPMEKLRDLQAEFDKMDLEEIRENEFAATKPATLSFKVKGCKTITIEDCNTLALLNNIIKDYLLTTPIKGYLLCDSEKVELSAVTLMYLFNKYLSVFLAPLRADKTVHACKDKSLLISRMIYILGIFRKKEMWEEYNSIGNKQNQLKGYLSKYKHPRYWHF